MKAHIEKALRKGNWIAIRTDIQETHIVVDIKDNVLVTDRGYVHISHVVEII